MAALGLVFYFADYRQVWNALREGNYALFLPLAFLFQFLSFVFRSLAWHTLLQKKIGVKKLFFTINIGYLVTNIFPFRAGEIARALLLSQSGVVSFWEVASTILIERAFDVLISVSLLLGSLPFVFALTSHGDTSWAQPAALLSGGIVLLSVFMLHIIARNRVAIIGWVRGLEQRWKPAARFGAKRVESFFDGLAALTDIRSFLISLGWMMLSWGANICTVYVLLKIFLDPVSLLWVTFSMGVVSMGIIVPSSPGSIGILEAAYVGALSVFNIGAAKALALALVSRTIYTVTTTIFGVYGLSKEGESLGHLYRRIINRKG